MRKPFFLLSGGLSGAENVSPKLQMRIDVLY